MAAQLRNAIRQIVSQHLKSGAALSSAGIPGHLPQVSRFYFCQSLDIRVRLRFNVVIVVQANLTSLQARHLSQLISPPGGYGWGRVWSCQSGFGPHNYASLSASSAQHARYVGTFSELSRRQVVELALRPISPVFTVQGHGGASCSKRKER